mmetsp:Transcript_71160/g.118265  ORF Transcript_71160/g.118265 Transcript_71160/m.118265 type:complete len:319 (-) Transcript_71160:40-996(-)
MPNTISHGALIWLDREFTEAEAAWHTLWWRHFEDGGMETQNSANTSLKGGWGGEGFAWEFSTWRSSTRGLGTVRSRIDAIPCGTDAAYLPRSCGGKDDTSTPDPDPPAPPALPDVPEGYASSCAALGLVPKKIRKKLSDCAAVPLAQCYKAIACSKSCSKKRVIAAKGWVKQCTKAKCKGCAECANVSPPAKCVKSCGKENKKSVLKVRPKECQRTNCKGCAQCNVKTARDGKIEAQLSAKMEAERDGDDDFMTFSLMSASHFAGVGDHHHVTNASSVHLKTVQRKALFASLPLPRESYSEARAKNNQNVSSCCCFRE